MDRYKEILKQVFGYDDFRGIQQEIIESIGAGRDTLGLMPTGGGKSVTFQVPALATEGVCLVVTPLIALMKDQVRQLRQKGIQAAAIYSGMRREEILQTLENAVFGGVKLLYLSPERLSSQIFLAKLPRIKVSFITVDEAHCISQWGYDFRPHYLEIARLRELLPDVPILALTATATPAVVDDIQRQLHFRSPRVISMSFARKNLSYVVRHTEKKEEELAHILSSVEGSAIVYVRSRRKCKEIADMLCQQGISATHYHAGLDRAVKDLRQRDWTDEKVRVMVATNAFGMGINKNNVRLVVHFQTPSSLEAYFQEAGRAGRDGLKAYAVLLYSASDSQRLERRISDTFPSREQIRQVYEDLGSFYQIAEGMGEGRTFLFDIDRFSLTFKHFPVQVQSALRLLTHARYIEYVEETDMRSRVKFLLLREELNRLADLSPKEERIVILLLRNYGGLFADYAYIDEEFLAHEMNLSREQTYLLLKGLSERRILHFIPQRNTPTLMFRIPRIEKEQIVISPQIYEDRQRVFAERIRAMKAYATTGHICRSRQLLAYFGETEGVDDCGICDVCIDRRNAPRSAEQLPAEALQVLSLLGDGRPHTLSELQQLPIKPSQLGEALRLLVQEERIVVENGTVRKY